MRCLTLADRLSAEGAACHFVTRLHPGHLAAHIRMRGYEVLELPAPGEIIGTGFAAWLGVSVADDAAQTLQALQSAASWDWLVVDHYALDAGWQSQLRAQAKRIMVIDDLADRPHDCDLLLDQNLQMPGRYDGLVPAACQLLLGPRYAMLRPEFANLRRSLDREARTGVSRLLLFMGGVDAPGYTPRAIAAIERACHPPIAVDVVIGPENPRKAEIEAFCASHDWATLHTAGADMATLMAQADLAIGAGGTTMWERCALALPTIIVAIAENQKPGAEAVAAAGAGLYVGDGATLPDEDLAAAVRTLVANPWLRRHLAEAAGALVDGRGVDRVVAQLADRAISLRRAEPSDCLEMLAWRNHQDTRRYFRDPRPVDSQTHHDWFSRSLDNPDRDLLIGEIDGRPIGVLRYDHSGGVATVSIYSVPGQAARGDGTRLLRAGNDWIAASRPDIMIIEAEVLRDNTASHQAFGAAGFQPFAEIYRRGVSAAAGRA